MTSRPSRPLFVWIPLILVLAGAAVATLVWQHKASGRTQRIDHLVEEAHDLRVLQKDSSVVEFPAFDQRSSLTPSKLNVQTLSSVASAPLGARLPLPGTLEFTVFDGPTKRLADFAGQPVLINLWASWCSTCVEELTGFVKHRETLQEVDVVVFACSVNEPSNRQRAIDMAKRLDFWFLAGTTDEQTLSLIDVIKNQTFDRYTPYPLPSSLLIDSQGRLARIYLGPCEASQIAKDVRTMESAQTDIDVLKQEFVFFGL